MVLSLLRFFSDMLSLFKGRPCYVASRRSNEIEGGTSNVKTPWFYRAALVTCNSTLGRICVLTVLRRDLQNPGSKPVVSGIAKVFVQVLCYHDRIAITCATFMRYTSYHGRYSAEKQDHPSVILSISTFIQQAPHQPPTTPQSLIPLPSSNSTTHHNDSFARSTCPLSS